MTPSEIPLKKASKTWLDVMNSIITGLEQIISRDEFTDEYIESVIRSPQGKQANMLFFKEKIII